MPDPGLRLLVVSTAECLELQTIETSGPLMPGLEWLMVEVRAVVDLEVVPESQIMNLAQVSLANKGT